ncbi:E-selectin-like [Diadema setosum]|uniref:E-selectin-like n=1 Tax=Diadema setosum TaxID=31175 RepID=UPI003B3BE770
MAQDHERVEGDHGDYFVKGVRSTSRSCLLRVGPTSSSSSSAAPSTASCNLSRVSGANPGSTFNEGSHTVQYRATDSAGNYATCTIRFVVVGYYVSGGSSSRTCQQTGNSGVWSGSAPSCARVTCSSLSAPSKGSISCTDGSYYNSRCTFSCNQGYSLQGSSSQWTCLSSGSWSNSGSSPTCADTTAPSFTHCPTSQSVYAPALATKATVTWSTPTATDNSGETITPVRVQGSPSGSQFSEGVHHTQYRAVDSAGNENTCSFSITVEAALWGTVFKVKGQQSANFRGQMESGLTDSHHAKAGSTSAYWVGATPVCSRILCTKPPLSTALQMVATSACPAGNVVPSGNQCQFSCAQGYYLQGNTALTLITCSSDDLPAPDHGRKVGCSNDREDYGTSCTLACEDGYEPKTPVSKTCSDDGDGDDEGIWTGSDIVCTIVTCPAMTPPTNGAISQCSFMGVVQPTTSPSQNYSAVCTIACNTGFTMTAGSGQRTCLSTGAWETPATTCSGSVDQSP